MKTSRNTILLIEDDIVLAKVLYEELSDADFEVFPAYDGEAGLRMVFEKMPNLILLDILLPKKNGFEVLEAIKKSPESNQIPIIILTMLGSDEDIKKGLQLGATDYIVKSQHALPEIVEKVRTFFFKEPRQETRQIMANQLETYPPDTVPSP